jgi:hypothetical protein
LLSSTERTNLLSMKMWRPEPITERQWHGWHPMIRDSGKLPWKWWPEQGGWSSDCPNYGSPDWGHHWDSCGCLDQPRITLAWTDILQTGYFPHPAVPCQAESEWRALWTHQVCCFWPSAGTGRHDGPLRLGKLHKDIDLLASEGRWDSKQLVREKCTLLSTPS